MASAHTHHGKIEEAFSLPLFAFTVTATLGALALGLKLLAPHPVWEAQISSPFWRFAAVFIGVNLFTCFVEYFFHRYVLHKPVVPILSRFYRQHTKHHGLTRIAMKRVADGRDLPIIENIYPILHDEQKEASFFPWYTLAVFSCVVAPLFALGQWIAPAFPWFFAGYIGLAFSLTLYEVLHAIEHWSLEKWMPLIDHPRFGTFWRYAYSFHLRHHAVIDCNESISGFFTLPLGDWLFGTCLIPKTLYAEGEAWAPAKFVSPKPVALIRWCDESSEALIKRRRQKAAGTPASSASLSAPASTYASWGEKILTRLTHGLGLALSAAALVLLVIFASMRGDAWHVVSFSLFGATLVLLYATSTLHHGFRRTRWQSLLQRFDRAAIFLLIAGTYTPFLLVNLRESCGWTLFAIVWGLCLAGVVFQLFFSGRFRVVATCAALLAGWVAVFAIKPIVAAVPYGALWLLLAGGLCYMLAMALRRLHGMPYHQAILRSFAIGGSVCHVLAVLLFVLPAHG